MFFKLSNGARLRRLKLDCSLMVGGQGSAMVAPLDGGGFCGAQRRPYREDLPRAGQFSVPDWSSGLSRPVAEELVFETRDREAAELSYDGRRSRADRAAVPAECGAIIHGQGSPSRPIAMRS